MRTLLKEWLIQGSAALLLATSAEAATLENRWLRVEIDESHSGDLLSLASKGNGIAQVRPKGETKEGLLDLFSSAESAPRGIVHRFTSGEKHFSGSDLGPWKVLTSDLHHLGLESADGSVRLDYLLPEDEAMLTKRVAIRNRRSEPMIYTQVANLQVGGDYRLLTEPTSDFIYIPGSEEGVITQEARSDIRWEVTPSQPWFSIVDRNKNQLLAFGFSHKNVTLLFESVNELDQESLLARATLPAVGPGESVTMEIYLTHAAGFSEIAYFGREALVAATDPVENLSEISVLPMSMNQRGALLISGGSDSGESWEVKLQRHQDDLPYRRKMRTVGSRYQGHLKEDGTTFLINAKKTQHSEL